MYLFWHPKWGDIHYLLRKISKSDFLYIINLNENGYFCDIEIPKKEPVCFLDFESEEEESQFQSCYSDFGLSNEIPREDDDFDEELSILGELKKIEAEKKKPRNKAECEITIEERFQNKLLRLLDCVVLYFGTMNPNDKNFNFDLKSTLKLSSKTTRFSLCKKRIMITQGFLLSKIWSEGSKKVKKKYRKMMINKDWEKMEKINIEDIFEKNGNDTEIDLYIRNYCVLIFDQFRSLITFTLCSHELRKGYGLYK